MGSLFRLPEEVLLAPLLESFPGRGHQIRLLATLLYVSARHEILCLLRLLWIGLPVGLLSERLTIFASSA